MNSLERMETVAKAAVVLSEAAQAVQNADIHTVAAKLDAYETADVAYKAAFRAYTNPFGVAK